jgi:hypothetical protein
MRDEGPDTAIETLDDDAASNDIPAAPEPSTLFVSADGKEQAKPDAAKEDEDDVLEEVADDVEGPPQHHNVPLSTMQVRFFLLSSFLPLPFLPPLRSCSWIVDADLLYLTLQPEEDEDEMLLEV